MRTLRHLGLVAVVVILGAILISGCGWFQETKSPEETKAAQGEGKPEPGATKGEKAQPSAVVKEEEGALKDIFFDLDKYNIRPDQRSSIEQDAKWLKSNPNVKITVEGHCDERGTSEYNMALGDRRAKALKDSLVKQGIDAKRIKTISYGKEKPFDPGHTEEAWAKNRRGHFVTAK